VSKPGRELGHRGDAVSAGKQCSETKCGERCACSYRNNMYQFDEEFLLSCNYHSDSIKTLVLQQEGNPRPNEEGAGTVSIRYFDYFIVS
jgi:hypothetical protein